MNSDFADIRNSQTHHGLQGTQTEGIVKDFLKKYLPRNLDISTGTIIDSNGKQSKQIDIILSDYAKTPIFYEKEGIRTIPIESVYTIIEVKSFLDVRELNKSLENMKSIKSLEKKAFFEDKGDIKYVSNLYGKEYDVWPINYYIFSFDSFDSVKLETILENMNMINKSNNLTIEKRIDSICILNKGVIINQRQNGQYSSIPESNSTLKLVYTPNNLLLFYNLIMIYLNQVHMPNFNFNKYLKNLTL